MNAANNVGMIALVAKGLGALKEKVVFVGGATVSFYLTEKNSTTIRPTDDVDCLVEITSRRSYYDLQTALEKAGFRHSQDEKAPVCRMEFSGIKVDIMPSDPRILGFSNIWYQEGIQQAVYTRLPNGDKVRIFSLPYFVAAKIEAYLGRGQGDFRLSSDMEDIITVLAGQRNLNALRDAPETVQTYLKKNFRSFISSSLFLEALSGHLDPTPDRDIKASRLVDRINNFLVT